MDDNSPVSQMAREILRLRQMLHEAGVTPHPHPPYSSAQSAETRMAEDIARYRQQLQEIENRKRQQSAPREEPVPPSSSNTSFQPESTPNESGEHSFTPFFNELFGLPPDYVDPPREPDLYDKVSNLYKRMRHGKSGK